MLSVLGHIKVSTVISSASIHLFSCSCPKELATVGKALSQPFILSLLLLLLSPSALKAKKPTEK